MLFFTTLEALRILELAKLFQLGFVSTTSALFFFACFCFVPARQLMQFWFSLHVAVLHELDAPTRSFDCQHHALGFFQDQT